MNRRGFLGTMLASVGALTIDPATLLWKPTPELAPVVPTSILTLEQMTRYVAERLSEGFHGEHVSGHLIGQEGLTHQFTVHFPPPKTIGQEGLAPAYLDPSVLALDQKLRAIRPTRFGCLPWLMRDDLDCHVVMLAASGLSVRGIRGVVPNFHDDNAPLFEELIRFDVLVGN
jgi:hypothetical protein